MKAIADLSREEVITAINKEYKIKLNGKKYIGKSMSKAVGYAGVLEEVSWGCFGEDPEEFVQEICRKALESTEDKYVKKLRRGLRITFYTQ